VSPSAAASRVRLVTTASLRFPARLPNRSNMSQLQAVNTLLPPRPKEPWQDIRAPSRRQLHKIREELEYRPTGRHYSTTVSSSAELMPERCWRAWALRFPLAQTQRSGRTAVR